MELKYKLIILLVSLIKLTLGEITGYECIDTLSDLENSDWAIDNGNPLDYAETGNDLPEPLKGRLEGNGILYFNGNRTITLGVGFTKQTKQLADAPAYFYMKYYGHEKGTSLEMSTWPDADVDVVYGGMHYYANTANFEWGEDYFRLDTDYLNDDPIFGVSISAYPFYSDNIFAIDKFVIAYGVPSGIQELANLCSSPSKPKSFKAIVQNSKLPFVLEQLKQH